MSQATRRKSAKKPQKILASTGKKPVPTREKENLNKEKTRWVAFFKDSEKPNNYINELARLYLKSATHAALINAKTTYTIGNGFEFHLNDEAKEPDVPFQAWLDKQNFSNLYRDMAFNWAWGGNLWIEGVRDKEDKDIVAYFVHSTEKCRISPDKKMCFISSFWEDIENARNKKKEYPITEVPMYDPEQDQKNFIIHIKRDAPSYDFYGLPDYVAATKDAYIEHKVDQYNLDRLNNGFFPSVDITYYGELPEGQTADEFVKDAKDTFTGEGQGGKMHIKVVEDASQAPQIHEFSSAKEGEFLKLEESAANGLVRAHRFFPALAGIETAGKLGNNQELVNQWSIVMNTVIEPDFQLPLNELAAKLFKIAGFEGWEVSQINIPPVALDLSNVPDGTVQKNEWRNQKGFAEDEALEGQYIGGMVNSLAKIIAENLKNGE